MPCKRRCENVVPTNIPDFDELMNFPLRVVVEDRMGNKKNMYMNAKLNLVAEEKKKDSFTNNTQDQLCNIILNTGKTSILKTPLSKITADSNKENKKKSVSFSDVMFSSPLVKNLNDKTLDLRKKTLIEQLKRCQETPILPLKCKGLNNQNDNSLSQSVTYDMKLQLSGASLFSHETEISLSDANTSHDENSLKVVAVEDRKRWILDRKRQSRLIKKAQGVNDSFWEVFNVEDAEAAVLKLCKNQSMETFAKIFPIKDRKNITKLGEGSFGEVFSLVDSDGEIRVVKFVPVQGDLSYNGGAQTSFDDIISEIVVARELSDMKDGSINKCRNFVQMKGISMVTGKFPQYFQREWDKRNAIKTSENDNPKKFGSSQKWAVIQFEFAGCPLEDFQLESLDQAYAILVQTCCALACAENYLEFEHRDLHCGNVLILKKQHQLKPNDEFIVEGKSFSVPHHGIQVTIIDFTFSRIKKGTNLVFTDMSKDKDIFLGMGDIQFDVYRQMKHHNKNEWSSFNPKTNILWLSYLGCKLLEKLKSNFSGLVTEGSRKSELDRLVLDIQQSKSANELIKRHLD